MNEVFNPSARSSALGAARNRVLRNTYALLALSMLPTVAGTWLGVVSGFGASFTGGMSLIVFLVGAFGFMWGIERNKNSGLGVLLLLGFTFFMGLMLSRLVGAILGLKNGADLVMLAFGGTAVIFGGMATLASTTKRDLSGMGKFLFVGALITFVGFIAAFFIQVPALTITLLVMCLGIFSAYLLYDINRVVRGGETNYVSATLAIYLDVFNVFQSLLALLGIFGGQSD